MFISTKRHRGVLLAACASMLGLDVAEAQHTDQTQTPNAERAGIFKSLEQQIGAGVGNVMTPDSSTYIIARDPARAVRRGRQLFQRKFTQVQGFGPRTMDGIGNIETSRAIGAAYRPARRPPSEVPARASLGMGRPFGRYGRAPC